MGCQTKKTIVFKSLILLFFSTPFISFGQFEKKSLVKEDNFVVSYYKSENYLVFLIESKYAPFIYTDINKNNIMDPYIDKLYSVIDGNSLCVSNKLENNAATTCGQSTKAVLVANRNEYQFIIPKNELTYSPKEPIYVSFGAYDKENKLVYSFTNKTKSYIIQ